MLIKDVNYRGILGIPTNRICGNSVENDMSGWRVMRPVIDLDKCKQCKICFIYCPDCAIDWVDNKPVINYQLCKGCQICSTECPVDAIKVVKE